MCPTISHSSARRLWLAYVLLIALLLVLPLNGTSHSLTRIYIFRFRLDQLLHVALFFPWVVNCVWAFGRSWALAATATGLAAAFLFEGIQFLLPYRSFNLLDLAANWAGVLLGAASLPWTSPRRKAE